MMCMSVGTWRESTKVVSDTTVYKGSFRPKNRGQEASGGVERM